jgi:hypothetical protein
MVKLVCIVEIPDAFDADDAQRLLDAWRERHAKCNRAGRGPKLTLYRATEQDADTGIYLQGGEE